MVISQRPWHLPKPRPEDRFRATAAKSNRGQLMDDEKDVYIYLKMGGEALS
jgi:hypothetical protein